MDGIILINKEKGISSFGVVSQIRKIFNTRKVGHCGTLDPNATGVLPVMIGQATKLSKYLVEHDKEYIAVLKLGIQTDSADSEGNIIKNDDFCLDNRKEDKYIEQINKLIGKHKQIPPMYSAIKVNGKKLYEYARSGINVQREPRDIEIYSINVEKINFDDNEITFKVKCSKGTYIRTLCETIANSIGTIGYMKELTRTKLDSFDIKDSVMICELENLENKEEKIIRIERLFENKAVIVLNSEKNRLFLNGVKLTQKMRDGIYRVYSNNEFMGIGIIKDNLLKRDIIV